MVSFSASVVKLSFVSALGCSSHSRRLNEKTMVGNSSFDRMCLKRLYMSSPPSPPPPPPPPPPRPLLPPPPRPLPPPPRPPPPRPPPSAVADVLPLALLVRLASLGARQPATRKLRSSNSRRSLMTCMGFLPPWGNSSAPAGWACGRCTPRGTGACACASPNPHLLGVGKGRGEEHHLCAGRGEDDGFLPDHSAFAVAHVVDLVKDYPFHLP